MTTIACSCSCSPDSLFYGMCEFTGCPFGGHAITKEPSISDKENVDNESHFRPTLEEDLIPAPKRFKFSDESQMKKLAEGLQPKATTDSTKWALKTVEQWSQDRNSSGCGAVPSTLLITENVSVLSKYLSLFVVEARKKNGEKYPPTTLHQILCGILRHMRQLNSSCPNFLDKGDLRFKPFHNTLDALFHNLHTGIKVKHAEIISEG